MTDISNIEKIEFDKLINLIKDYLKPENKNIEFLTDKIFIPYLNENVNKYLMLLFTYFKKLDKVIWDIDTINDKSSYKYTDLEKYIEKYKSYFIRESDSFDVIIGTLYNMERSE